MKIAHLPLQQMISNEQLFQLEKHLKSQFERDIGNEFEMLIISAFSREVGCSPEVYRSQC